MIYHKDNRLGMAWVMKTHFDKVIKDVEKGMPSGTAKLLKKGAAASPVVAYLDKLNSNCYVCNRINQFFLRYVDTVFFLYKSDSEFKEKIKNSKGFCNEHYNLLIKECGSHLKGTDLEEFVELTNKLYLDNLKRVRDDIEWFINKFDYKYQNEPWYNAKDSVIRSMIKTNGVFIE